MMRLLGVLLLASGLGGCAAPPYTNVDNTQLKEHVAQGVPLYDVRRPGEWRQTGVVEGSRTDALARHLVEQMGYIQVYNVRHGITRWIGKGNPVVRN